MKKITIGDLDLKVVSLDSNVTLLREEMVTGFASVNQQFDLLNDKTRGIGIHQEETTRKMNLLLEIVTPYMKKAEKIDPVIETLGDHNHRLKVLEYSFK